MNKMAISFLINCPEADATTKQPAPSASPQTPIAAESATRRKPGRPKNTQPAEELSPKFTLLAQVYQKLVKLNPIKYAEWQSMSSHRSEAADLLQAGARQRTSSAPRVIRGNAAARLELLPGYVATFQTGNLAALGKYIDALDQRHPYSDILGQFSAQAKHQRLGHLVALCRVNERLKVILALIHAGQSDVGKLTSFQDAKSRHYLRSTLLPCIATYLTEGHESNRRNVAIKAYSEVTKFSLGNAIPSALESWCLETAAHLLVGPPTLTLTMPTPDASTAASSSSSTPTPVAPKKRSRAKAADGGHRFYYYVDMSDDEAPEPLPPALTDVPQAAESASPAPRLLRSSARLTPEAAPAAQLLSIEAPPVMAPSPLVPQEAAQQPITIVMNGVPVSLSPMQFFDLTLPLGQIPVEQRNSSQRVLMDGMPMVVTFAQLHALARAHEQILP